VTLAIRTTGLTKRYDGVPAVDGLDLAVERGELYGFLGPNGAGKTTTIRMALGLIHATSGEVEVLGERVTTDRGPLRRVGALVEEPAFWKYLSGRRNLEYFARAGGRGEDTDRRLARVDECLSIVGLAEAASKRVKAYSQGMRQRLGIALALLGEPELLMLDEPTNGLDPTGMREVRRLLRQLTDAGTTVFVSSHLLSEVEAMCDRVGVMAQGRILAEGAPGTLRGAADRLRVDVDDVARASKIARGLVGATIAEPDMQAHGAGAITVTLQEGLTPADVNAALVRAGVRVNALVPVGDTLEDVFLHLVEGADVPR
jgi:ABC-type multidrug transport system ATPase subunit